MTSTDAGLKTYKPVSNPGTIGSYQSEQVGQLSQTNRAAAWVSFGKNVSEKSMHLTSPYYTAQNMFRNAETFRRVHQ